MSADEIRDIHVIIEGRGDFYVSRNDLEQFADDWDSDWARPSVDDWLDTMLSRVRGVK